MLNLYKAQLKISESLYNTVKEKIINAIESRDNFNDIVRSYRENASYKDYRIALSFDLLRCIGKENNTNYILEMYDQGLNDEHINRTMIYMLKNIF